MKRNFIWYYRQILFAAYYAKWLMLKERPKYQEGSQVIVRFRSAIYGAEEVLCRIREINYRFHGLTYEVVILEEKEWLPFGTKTFVYPENILRKPPPGL